MLVLKLVSLGEFLEKIYLELVRTASALQWSSYARKR